MVLESIHVQNFYEQMEAWEKNSLFMKLIRAHLRAIRENI